MKSRLFSIFVIIVYLLSAAVAPVSADGTKVSLLPAQFSGQSTVPSLAPVVLRASAALPALADVGLNSAPGQPQALASFCDGVAEIPIGECQALEAFYNTTGGANWIAHTDWLVTSTPCSWYGVACVAGHVDSILLENDQLSGTLPSELGNLANLQDLHLSWNHLTGSIPSQMSNLAHLQKLDLGNNRLSGTIPSELGNLANLQTLLLGANQLSGTIPSELGNLANLQDLHLDWNHLTGSIPSQMSNLANLQTLLLDNNRLSGTIPSELGNLANLQTLLLGSNQLSGTIPSELGNLAHLQMLELGSNQLSGSIPPELGNLANLRDLFLGGNKLTGSIPSQLDNLAVLQLLNLDNNQLSGTIPSELGNLANLQHLSLGGNQLTGSIPSQLDNLAALQYLMLDSNQLSGTIPPELGNLANLQMLELSYNHLTGSIPPELGNLTKLRILRLGWNLLGGSFPASMVNLTALTDLDLRYNGLTASVPAVISFLDSKEPGWDQTQTVPPTHLRATPVGSSVQLSWIPAPNFGDYDFGYYEVYMATQATGPFALVGTTVDKKSSAYVVTSLLPEGPYYFRLRTHSPALVVGPQQNDWWSDYTDIISTRIAGIQTTVDPAAGGTLAYPYPNNSTSVVLPPGALTARTTIAFSPITTFTAPHGCLFAGHAFDLDAYRDEVPLPGFAFSTRVTVTVHYVDSDVMGMSEQNLWLDDWNGSAWADAACGPYDRHPDENWLAVPICHLSRFALFGSSAVYLPLLRR